MRNGNLPLSSKEILAIHQGVELENLEWTKDSSKIIFRAQYSGTPEFYQVPVEGGAPIRLTVDSQGNSPRLSPDGKWLSYLSKKSGSQEIWLHPMNLDECAVAIDDLQLTKLGAEVNAYNWAPDGKNLVASCNRFGSFDVFEVSVPSGEWKRLTDGDDYQQFPVYSSDGSSIFFVELDNSWENHRIIEISRDGTDPKLIAQDSDFFDYQIGRRFSYPLISPNGANMLFRSQRNNWINYWQVSVANPGDPTPLSPEEFDQAAESGSITFGDAAYSPDGSFVAYVSNRDGNVQLSVVSTDTGETTRLVGENGGIVTHPTWSPDGKKLAYLFQSFTAPPDVWAMDIDITTEPVVGLGKQLTQSMPQGLARKFSIPQKISYRSFDGLPISAYIYRPTDKSSRIPGPAIIEVHGGPVDQFRDNLHLVVQYYVQRGYTVMMCNVRGSAGYGKKFEDGISNGWGVDDLKDLVSAAEYLIEEGIADPLRIAITGQSYGGFLSMAAACFTPKGLFQAAISRTGYADWSHYYQHGSQRTVKLMRHSMGPMEENLEAYTKGAPLGQADQATVPLFIVDQESTPTDPNPGLRATMAAALGAANKVVKYGIYTNTGGPYARSREATEKLLPDMIDFFKKYIG